MKFAEMTATEFRALGRSLNSHMSLGDIMMIPMSLGSKSDEEVQEIVDKMDKKAMPSDYEVSQNRQLVRLACMNAF